MEATTKENEATTKNTETKSEKKDNSVNTEVINPTEKLDSNPETAVTETPTTAAKYVPISEGWKATDSAKVIFHLHRRQILMFWLKHGGRVLLPIQS